MGCLIINEPHKLLHELACEMRRSSIRIKRKFTFLINNDQLKIVYEVFGLVFLTIKV